MTPDFQAQARDFLKREGMSCTRPCGLRALGENDCTCGREAAALAQLLAEVAGAAPTRSGTVAEISDAELLRRALRFAATRVRRRGRPAWSGAVEVFALGSTYAAELCVRFGVDPDSQPRPGEALAGAAMSEGSAK